MNDLVRCYYSMYVVGEKVPSQEEWMRGQEAKKRRR